MTRERDWLCPFCGSDHRRRVCGKFLQTLPVVTGTMGPNREYIPPPGVSVTVRVLPPGVAYDHLRPYAATAPGQPRRRTK